ncbi:hypothetical protein [Burkholderia thailandensis]|uniref:Uncharacterized protein n=1 Tax=Burkholderia thailandensis TaxID=57975 RepID=A0AAW9CNB4_BURTH|nr:hypothetical protein [Burkholderia thailandensis]AHI68436.1 hypothetical protein BTL_4342 [Burkholderia thailandensis H0587]AHI76780.1 hypothetical protein BTQ_4868 [Burkholderia thailandensis 2002721723]AHI81751.1 hypothetical protein BTJ_3493 [Burkholderia thailandensis E444]AIC90271.1 hypothetical protein BTRA_4100 [Burkholderia thailandensis USAMRU Malaysia \
MYRFIRTATVKNAAALPSALAFASEVTTHLNKSYALNMSFGAEQFGCSNIHWHFDSDSLDRMEQVNEKLMGDRDYAALLDKYQDIWAEGSMHDTVVRLA